MRGFDGEKIMSETDDIHAETKRWIRRCCKGISIEQIDWENASPPKRYNCFGFAVGVLKWWQCWEYERGGRIKNARDHWKKELPSNDTVEAYTKAAESEGFSVCDSGWEAAYEKIVLCYIEDGDKKKFTHAARQVSPDRWKSKIGKESDFEHPESLDCEWHGNGRVYMRRLRIAAESSPASPN
jgi:hypothetical protein